MCRCRHEGRNTNKKGEQIHGEGKGTKQRYHNNKVTQGTHLVKAGKVSPGTQGW